MTRCISQQAFRVGGSELFVLPLPVVKVIDELLRNEIHHETHGRLPSHVNVGDQINITRQFFCVHRQRDYAFIVCRKKVGKRSNAQTFARRGKLAHQIVAPEPDAAATREVKQPYLLRYVIECRMERAKSLLRESNLPINEIAQMVGYSSQSHFSTVFRQFTGRSPMRYRSDA